jgi:VIT1/CCC1 family predicted Fe2+/Mn2+ transporter
MTVKRSIKTGIGFGLTSGIITTLGLMFGLQSGTHSRLAVLGGILTIAVADAFSDAMGIHVSEETKNGHPVRYIWEATVTTFLSKLIFSLSFAVPVLIFPLNIAVIICLVWGLLLLTIFSIIISHSNKERVGLVVAEHVIITIIVITITHFLGELISSRFG